MDSHMNAYNKENAVRVRYTKWLLISAITVSLVGSFTFGYGISGANLYESYYNRLLMNKTTDCVNPQSVAMPAGDETTAAQPQQQRDFSDELLIGLPQTLFVLGCFLGAFTANLWPSMSPVFNRNVCILLTFPLFALSCACTGIGYANPSLSSIIYFGRIVHGYASGLACVFVPTYLNEISTKETYEKIGIIHQLFITIGIFTGNLVGYHNLLGNCQNWVWANVFGIFPVSLGAILIPFIPKSPKQLLAEYKDEEAAKAALQKLRDSNDVEDELNQMKQDLSTSNDQKISFLNIIKSKQYRWPLITSVAVLTCQALSGINAVFFYSGNFLETINSDLNFTQTASIIIAGFNVLFTFVAFPIINKFGIRRTLMSTLLAMMASHVVLTILVNLGLNNQDNQALQWSIVSFLVLFVLFFAIGIGPIAFMYPNDIFDRRSVDTALSIGLCFNYAGNIFVSISFIPLRSAIKGYVFLVYAVCILLTFVLLVFKMQKSNSCSVEPELPLETKGEKADSSTLEA